MIDIDELIEHLESSDSFVQDSVYSSRLNDEDCEHPPWFYFNGKKSSFSVTYVDHVEVTMKTITGYLVLVVEDRSISWVITTKGFDEKLTPRDKVKSVSKSEAFDYLSADEEILKNVICLVPLLFG